MGLYLKAYCNQIAVVLAVLVVTALLFRLDVTIWFLIVAIAVLVILPLEAMFYGLEKGKNQQAVRKIEKIKGIIIAICWCVVVNTLGIF